MFNMRLDMDCINNNCHDTIDFDSNYSCHVTCLHDLELIVNAIKTNWKFEWNNNLCIWPYYTLFSTIMVFCQVWMILNSVICHTMNAQWLPHDNNNAVNVYWIVNLILATFSKFSSVSSHQTYKS